MTKLEEKKKRKYHRYKEACEEYGVSLSTMKRWVNRIGCSRKVDKLVLINTEVLDEFLESCLAK